MDGSTIPYYVVEERKKLNRCIEEAPNDYEKEIYRAIRNMPVPYEKLPRQVFWGAILISAIVIHKNSIRQEFLEEATESLESL